MKKTIQRYKEESVSTLNSVMEVPHLEDDHCIFSNYTQRLLLTWLYSNSNPPILLSPITKLNMVSSKNQEPIPSSFQISNLSVQTNSLDDIQLYVKSIITQWESVISFFYSQHVKRSEQYCGNLENSNQTMPFNEKSDSYQSLLISCIYYADLFVRSHQKNSKPISIIEILIISICITIKFWMEEKMCVNKYLSQIFSIPLKRINDIEIYCLELINYQIYLSEKDIQIFSNIIYKCHLNNNSNNINNSSNPSHYNNKSLPVAISSEPTTPQITSYNNSNNNNNNNFINSNSYVNIQQPQYIQSMLPLCININNNNSSTLNTPNCLSSTTNTPIYSSPIVTYFPHAAPSSIPSPFISTINNSPYICSPISSPLSCKSPVKYIPKTPINNTIAVGNSPSKCKSYIHNNITTTTNIVSNNNNNNNNNNSSSFLIKPRYIITSTNRPNTIKISRSLHHQHHIQQHHILNHNTHISNANNHHNNNIIIVVPQKL